MLFWPATGRVAVIAPIRVFSVVTEDNDKEDAEEMTAEEMTVVVELGLVP